MQPKNVENIVAALARKVNVSLSSADFDVIHRVCPQKTEKQNIVVKFCSRATGDHPMLQAKKTKGLLEDLSRERIYINDHQYPERKILFGSAIHRIKSCHWKYMWVSERKTLAKTARG